MNKISLLIVVIFALAGCSKLEVNETNILGTWMDDYSDYPYYAPEGSETYTFKADIHFYDVFASEHDVRRTLQDCEAYQE